jgi:hypothetical protein
MRMVRPEPTAAEIAAAALAEREQAAKDAAARWEATQAAQHAEWVKAAQADMVLRAARALRDGTDNVGFTGDAGTPLPTIDVPEDEWVDILGIKRGRRRLS